MAVRTRFTVILALTLALAACGGSSTVECTQEYWDGEVGTCLPAGWHVLDRGNLDDRGVPEEAVVAFQTDESVGGQYLTIVVTREELADEVTSPDYSEAGVASVSSLPGYTRIEERTVTIDGEKHILHVFTAQPSEEQPMARFYQVSMAKGREGYTFTAATPVSIDDSAEDRIVTILLNATLVAPEEKPADDKEAE